MSTFAPGAAAALARRLFLRPPRFEQPRRELWWETDAKRFALAVNLPDGPTHLAAWQWGSAGPTVVLIHGWGGRGLQLGALAQPLVELGFRVLAVDLPAHGQSPGTTTSLPEAAKAVSAVLSATSEEPGGVAAVVAHSFGCAVTAVALADGAPSPQRVIFLAPPSDLDAVTGRFAELSGFSLEVMGRLQRDLSRRFRFEWSSLHPWRLAGHMKSPLLVIHDIFDEETPWTAGQRLAEASSDGRLHVTRGHGHFQLLRAQEVIDSVLAFLRPQEGARDAA